MAVGTQCAGHSFGGVDTMMSILIQTILGLQCSISSPEMWPADYYQDSVLKGLDAYDFVVIGAGSAGSVVANRLTENSNWKVLLLEAGGDPPAEAEIPAFGYTLLKSKVDWDFTAEPSLKYSKAFPKGTYWPRGKMLGGSSSLSNMIYLRGNPRDYDNWEELGNPSWSYRDVLPFFRKSEDNKAEGILKRGKSKFHTTGGPLKISNFFSGDGSHMIFSKAAQELDFEVVNDLNGKKFLGFTNAQGTLFNGTRQSSAKAFLSPIKDRENLHVIKNAYVTQLLFSSENDRVVGAKYYVRGKKYTVKANKEVILSAGAIGSPQILMQSGIGPSKHLKKHRVKVKHDLPVGKNLQDHVYVPLFIKLKDSNTTFDPKVMMDNFYVYISNRIGPLSTIGSLDFVGFVNTKNDSTKFPDIQYHHATYHRGNIDLKPQLETMGYHKQVIKEVMGLSKEMDVLIVPVVLLNPKSRGRVRLLSKDAFDKPRITPNYLDMKEDVYALVRGIQLYEKFLETNNFKSLGAELIQFKMPECDVFEYKSSDYWECYSKYYCTTSYNPAGTVKMGPESDPNSVVDSTLKIHKVKGIRVVDASIMPNIVSANINAATIMIGEKGADFIKQDHAYKNVEL